MKNQRRLPAYPLFVKDPNFSLWCATGEPQQEQRADTEVPQQYASYGGI